MAKTKKKSEHYVNNKEFLAAMVEYKKSVDAAKKAQKFADAAFTAARGSCEMLELPDYAEMSTEIISPSMTYCEIKRKRSITYA